MDSDYRHWSMIFLCRKRAYSGLAVLVALSIITVPTFPTCYENWQLKGRNFLLKLFNDANFINAIFICVILSYLMKDLLFG